MFAKKTVFLFILAFCLTTSCFAEDPVQIQLAEQAIWKHKLSQDEQAIVDSFNVQRASAEIDSFELNVKISKAIKDKAEKIILSHVDIDTISIESKLVDFMSSFGDKAYVFKGGSKMDILDHIRLNYHSATRCPIPLYMREAVLFHMSARETAGPPQAERSRHLHLSLRKLEELVAISLVGHWRAPGNIHPIYLRPLRQLSR